MKKYLATVILSCTVCITAYGQTSGSNLKTEPIINEINERIKTFSNAFVRADTLVLSSLLTDEYIHTNTDGSVLSKHDWLAWVQTQYNALQEGGLRIDNYVNDSVDIKIYGSNTAVVTGLNISQGERDGKAFSTHIRFTHVWIRVDGHWRRAAFHDTRIDR